MSTVQPASTTGHPMVCLVDLDGSRIGPGEKDIPDVRPEPAPADTWPLWTDLVRAHVGRRDRDDHAMGVLAGDLVRSALARADALPDDPDDFDAAMERLEEEDPIPAEIPENFRTPEEWDDGPFPAEPPDGWEGSAAAGWASLPPIRGGSPFEPSPDDWADYRNHFDRAEALYGYE